jgi:hypothetical protein
VNIEETLAPDSDQLDAIDLVSGPKTFTITQVSKGNAEQPVQIKLAEFPRVWRPGKSMRRVLASCWGTDASEWIGRRVTLYCDPEVMFGKDKVGGTRISHLSHIDQPKKVPLLVSRGKSAMFTVQPLTEEAPPPEPTAEEVAACADQAALKLLWDRATSDERKEQIRQRKADLDNEPDPAA